MISSILTGCSGAGSDMETTKHDHEAISTLLDTALLAENPRLAFEHSLKEVSSYRSVDSAWISGSNFFVKYKQGGIVSWFIPHP